MSRTSINRVVLEGELDGTPEYGDGFCRLRLLVTTLRKTTDGEWVGRPNRFDVLVEGAEAERASGFLAPQRPIGIEGRLAWIPADGADPNAHSRVEIHADAIRALDVQAAQLIPVEAPAAVQGADGAVSPGPGPDQETPAEDETDDAPAQAA